MQTHTYTSARLLFFSPRRYLSRYVQTFFSFLFLPHYFGGNGIREFVPHPLYPIPRAPSYRDCSRPSRCCYMPKSIPCIYPSTYLHMRMEDAECTPRVHDTVLPSPLVTSPPPRSTSWGERATEPAPPRFVFPFFPPYPPRAERGEGTERFPVRTYSCSPATTATIAHAHIRGGKGDGMNPLRACVSIGEETEQRQQRRQTFSGTRSRIHVLISRG